MEKLEGIILIIVVLAGIVGLYFIYAGVGFAGLQMEQKTYCLPGQDVAFRLVGGLEPQFECDFRFTYRPPGELPSSETGTIALAGIMGGKASFDVIDSSGEYRTTGLAEREVWSDVIIAIMVKSIDERRQQVVAEFQPNIPEICVGNMVWDYTLKRRVCPPGNLESYAQQKFKLRKDIWGQSQPVPI